MNDNVQPWTFRASTYTDGPGRPVRIAVNRGLKSGKIDFVAISDDEAIELATEILEAVRRSRRSSALPDKEAPQ